MFPRIITDYIARLARQFPVVTITGPRQSGKTTLIREMFPDKPYYNLEDYDIRQTVQSDAKGFLNALNNGAVFDEAQNMPELFSCIQVVVDEHKKKGEFILSGSQNFLLMAKIKQSLAGRVGVVDLLPLQLSEIPTVSDDVFEHIHRGFYPQAYAEDVNTRDWCRSYLRTYVERDLSQLQAVFDLDTFQTFLGLCAGRVGQVLNTVSLGDDCGITHNTVKSWLSLLKTSYIAFTLKPYHRNFRKRLIKQPKLYFYDTALVCYLLNIEKPSDIWTHYMKGPLFENFAILEMIKNQWNHGKDHNLYFWRDHTGHEVDVIWEKSSMEPIPIEIKASKSFSPDFFKNIQRLQALTDIKKAYVIYSSEKTISWTKAPLISFRDIPQIFEDTSSQEPE